MLNVILFLQNSGLNEKDFIKAISSRSRFYGDYVVPWDRDQLTYRVFRNHLLDGISNIGDRLVLERMLIGPDQVDQAQIALLTNEGKTVYRLLKGVAYEETHDLVKQLSPSTTKFLREISPSTNVGDLKARVLIMHDRSDKLVPSEESRRFADAVTEKTDTYITEFSLIATSILAFSLLIPITKTLAPEGCGLVNPSQ